MGSNNSETFLKFIKNLKERAMKMTVVVMDNLSVHKTRAVMAEFDDDFRPQFMPPHSCALNPIEHLWSVVKQQWRKTFQFLAFKDYENDRERNMAYRGHLEQILGKYKAYP